ncbi:hydroxyacylglutathione hydrolase-like protein [Elysia marginata]|uniref:Hydroxyacylglutathione hydrolase-like protein n=1 Tax=Elysia marginata TaxID=1093978 RepID=A0AAV4FCM9_9GAST|nr:hydroxyacylglutathione hydrolase-like protein [Elysia marginata]
MGSCVFKAGYTLYADTCIGRCIHNRFIASFQKQFGENAMHSKLTPFVFQDLLILPIPVLVNNYAYLVADLSEHVFVLVDVGDATIIKKMNVQPEAVLTTHKHWDHSGGNRLMRATFPALRVYGGALDHVPDSTHAVDDGQELRFGNLRFTAMWTPGHTKGHTVWRLDGSHFGCADSVFSGDLLMLAGCGAAFEGPIRQLNASLNTMKGLPDDTMVWPGHELALENLELAVFIEPENIKAVLKLVWAFNQREAKICTCPSTIDEPDEKGSGSDRTARERTRPGNGSPTRQRPGRTRSGGCCRNTHYEVWTSPGHRVSGRMIDQQSPGQRFTCYIF